jgi:antitoxin component YwqK of YwqJK toxin-antitoxin module
MKQSYLIILFLIPFVIAQAQESDEKDGYTVFYYENGKKSSEGTMKDGKPDDYWKT